MENHFSINLSESLASIAVFCFFRFVLIFLFIYFPLANDELLKAFGRSKDGNVRVIKASIEKGN